MRSTACTRSVGSARALRGCADVGDSCAGEDVVHAHPALRDQEEVHLGHHRLDDQQSHPRHLDQTSAVQRSSDEDRHRGATTRSHRRLGDLDHHRQDDEVVEAEWAFPNERAACELEAEGSACPTGSSVAVVVRSVALDHRREDEAVPTTAGPMLAGSMLAGPMQQDALVASKGCRSSGLRVQRAVASGYL